MAVDSFVWILFIVPGLPACTSTRAPITCSSSDQSTQCFKPVPGSARYCVSRNSGVSRNSAFDAHTGLAEIICDVVRFSCSRYTSGQQLRRSKGT